MKLWENNIANNLREFDNKAGRSVRNLILITIFQVIVYLGYASIVTTIQTVHDKISSDDYKASEIKKLLEVNLLKVEIPYITLQDLDIQHVNDQLQYIALQLRIFEVTSMLVALIFILLLMDLGLKLSRITDLRYQINFSDNLNFNYSMYPSSWWPSKSYSLSDNIPIIIRLIFKVLVPTSVTLAIFIHIQKNLPEIIDKLNAINSAL